MNYSQPSRIEYQVIYVPIRHYICRELSTNRPFLCKTNPILSAAGGLQINLSILSKKAYKNFIPLAGQKNKPKTNPIKPNLKIAKMNTNVFIIKDCRKKDDFTVRINKPNSRKTQNERKRFFTKGL